MVSSWAMIFSMGYIHVCISNKTYMEKPLCLIAYAKSLRKNNLAWFISAFACGFARLRAPAKHRRNAFAAKVGTALLTKSLHPQKNVAHLGSSCHTWGANRSWPTWNQLNQSSVSKKNPYAIQLDSLLSQWSTDNFPNKSGRSVSQ